jgi:NAD(P)H-dependent flavin oxidoreductase YrpB (nitropropane dioxygenase family)
MLTTRVCELLGIEHPLIAAPMGPNLSDSDLVAAVSEAGALGVLQAQLCPPEMLRDKLRELRRRTSKPFGVNLILHFPSEHLLEVCLAEGVPLISFFWGDPGALVERCHRAGAKVMLQIGSVEAARRAAAAGVDLIVAQGVEAGGHVAGAVGTMALVPRVVDLVAPVPVAAAGGIADARGVVAALALGAEAVVLGTRFLATPEANVHPVYRERLLAAEVEDTAVTTLFGQEWPDAPHRGLRTALMSAWLDRDGSAEARSPDQPLVGTTRIAGQEIPLPRFTGFAPCADARGDIDAMSLLAGQGVGLVNDLRPAAELVRALVEGAAALIRQRLAGIAAGAASQSLRRSRGTGQLRPAKVR